MALTFAAFTETVSVLPPGDEIGVWEVNVVQAGADNTGASSAVSSFNTGAAALTGAADPTTTIRQPTKLFHIPGGKYKIDASVLFRSIQGLHIKGDGKDATFIDISGSPASVFDLDGIAGAVIEGITFIDTGGSATPDRVINLHWSAGTYRSTTNVTFRDVDIRNVHWTTAAVGVGMDDTVQVDNIKFDNCLIAGNWSPGNTTTYKYGVKAGNGGTGNVLTINYYGCEVAHCAVGISWDGSNGAWYGGQMESNGCDFDHGHVNGSGPVVVDGLRSEHAGRLFQSSGVGTTACSNVNLRNIAWDGSSMTDAQFIKHRHAGTLGIDGLRIYGTPAFTPGISADCGGLLIVTAKNLALPAPFTFGAGNTFDGQAQWRILSYLRLDTPDGTISCHSGLAQASDGVHPALTHLIGATYEPAFQNSWANNGSGYAPARFFKTLSGLVVVEGGIRGGANASIAFTLPSGFRIPNTGSLAFRAFNNSDATARCIVDSSGNVTLYGTATATDDTVFSFSYMADPSHN